MANVTQTYGSYTALTSTNLQSLADSATAGWQSDRVSNLSTKAEDYLIMVEIAAVNTAPADPKAIYVYAAPCMSTDGGTTWKYVDVGANSDNLDGAEGTVTIAEPNSLKQLGVIPYTTQNMVLNGQFSLKNAFGDSMPDGFQIVIINDSGMQLASSGNIVAYQSIAHAIA